MFLGTGRLGTGRISEEVFNVPGKFRRRISPGHDADEARSDFAGFGGEGIPRRGSIRVSVGEDCCRLKGGARVGRPRQSRIFRVFSGGWRAARIRRRPLQSGHSRTSTCVPDTTAKSNVICTKTEADDLSAPLAPKTQKTEFQNSTLPDRIGIRLPRTSARGDAVPVAAQEKFPVPQRRPNTESTVLEHGDDRRQREPPCPRLSHTRNQSPRKELNEFERGVPDIRRKADKFCQVFGEPKPHQRFNGKDPAP
jgi:hypothetical protein